MLSDLLREQDAGAAGRQRELALESHAINLMTVRRHEDAIPIWTRLIDEGANVRYAEGSRFHCQLYCCDWTDYAATAARLEAAVTAGRSVDRPFSFFVYSSSAEAQLRCSRTFVADCHPQRAPQALAPGKPRHADGRIRIAYASFDFHEHATAYLLAGLLELHDRSRFEITALSYGEDDRSPIRSRLEACVDRFIDVSDRTDEEIARLIRDLRIQIAVDLKGFTGGARTGVFAHRPAPLQVNFLGYPGTMGAEYIDYIIADRLVIPEPDQRFYAESVVYMPACYQPNDSQRPRPARSRSRAEHGLPERGTVFCSFNNLYKMAPVLFEVWLDLLRKVEGSVLWMLDGTAAAMRNLRSYAQAAGVAPGRLLFAPYIPLAQHLERYRHADIFLDSMPCNAHTTASDALWMGVPVLTVTGRTFAGRVASSLLHAVGLSELCHATIADYAAQALHLAQSPGELAALKSHLERGVASFPLFDTAAYCRHLERAFESMWMRYARGEQPSVLVVDP
jgi:predicted O-linked N-acetylglucosamine transferase (SPINDLY family)